MHHIPGYVSFIHKIATFLKWVGALGALAALGAVWLSPDTRWFRQMGIFASFATAFFFILDILLLIGFCYAFLKLLRYRPPFVMGKRKAYAQKNLRSAYFKDRWQKLTKKYMGVPTSDSMRLAIIEADALVDAVLKDYGFPGEHLADRLMSFTPEDMKSLNRLWDAHRVRNDIVHRPGAGISVGEGKKAIESYEAFLKELEVL